MNDFEQGLEDYWHYDFPRKPSSAAYMAGWQVAEDDLDGLEAEIDLEEDDVT